jgi:hypothetical protein
MQKHLKIDEILKRTFDALDEVIVEMKQEEKHRKRKQHEKEDIICSYSEQPEASIISQ